MSTAVEASSKAKCVEEVAAVALALCAVNEPIAKTCRKLDDLHVEVKKRELKRFDERAR